MPFKVDDPDPEFLSSGLPRFCKPGERVIKITLSGLFTVLLSVKQAQILLQNYCFFFLLLLYYLEVEGKQLSQPPGEHVESSADRTEL